MHTLGITSLSKSHVSQMAKSLDVQVEAFRTRPLDAGPDTFLAADAQVLKVRESGRTVNGYRETFGLHVTSAEDGAGWLAFFRDITAPGLSGVPLVTSEAHRGLVEAIGATLPGRERLPARCDRREYVHCAVVAAGPHIAGSGYTAARPVRAEQACCPTAVAVRALARQGVSWRTS